MTAIITLAGAEPRLISGTAIDHQRDFPMWTVNHGIYLASVIALTAYLAGGVKHATPVATYSHSSDRDFEDDRWSIFPEPPGRSSLRPVSI